jgi:hypothetical protein
MYSLMLSLVLVVVGVVLWIEGGPHPRTAGPWLLLGRSSSSRPRRS